MAWFRNLRFRAPSGDHYIKSIEALAGRTDEGTLRILSEAIRSDDRVVRCAAAKTLGTIPTPKGAELAAILLQDENSDVCCAAVRAFAKRNDPSAKGLLLPLLRDCDPHVRACAGISLAALGWKPSNRDEQALYELSQGNLKASAHSAAVTVQPLVGQLRNDTGFIRRAAAEALEKVNDPRRIAPLLNAVHDPDPMVRVSALHALSREQSSEVTTTFLDSLRDPDDHVRLAAAQILEKIADSGHGPFFIGLLSDPHFELRLTAVQYFRRLGDPLNADLLTPLLEDTDGDVRLAVVQALGVFQSDLAIPGLVTALTDEDRTVRVAAEAALSSIDPEWERNPAAQQATVGLESRLDDSRAWVSAAAGQTLARLRGAVSHHSM